MNPKEFYRNYRADNKRAELNEALTEIIKAEAPGSVFEFGCGSGKNLIALDCVVCGLDISLVNVLTAHLNNNLPFVVVGDETHLGHFRNFDVSFTCSVLDHILDIDKIIDDLKAMTNYAVVLAETNDVVGPYYFRHDYESYGFRKLEGFKWIGEDEATYYIWIWRPSTTNES